MKQEPDSEQDTNIFGYPCDKQDSSSQMEDTDVLRVSQDGLCNPNSYIQDKYILEDSADAQLCDQGATEYVQEESATSKPAHSEDVRSQSVVRKIKVV